jgi:hypothetical protein
MGSVIVNCGLSSSFAMAPTVELQWNSIVIRLGVEKRFDLRVGMRFDKNGGPEGPPGSLPREGSPLTGADGESGRQQSPTFRI